MSNKSKGTKYEKYIERICRSIQSYNCFKLIELSQNKIITGNSGVEHQIDVYWDFIFNSIRYKYIFECKDYESKISKDKVATLESISRDIPNSIPVIVSTKGFQSGAQAYAKAMGVFPFICRELTDDDWQNRVKVFEIQLIVVCNPHVNIRVEYNDELHNNSNKKSISLTNLKETILYDYEKNVEISIFEFAKEWLKSSCEDRHESFHFKNAYLICEPEDLRIRISNLIISVSYEKTEETISIDGDDFIQGLIIDVMENQKAIVYNNGLIKQVD
ncbi:MAG: restriction endonuclease [Clostridia bacterium]|nr:restriction endonuclease [Clostridia bacterium]MBR0159007.1 restriction endonuclease [Clostridia bacterium]